MKKLLTLFAFLILHSTFCILHSSAQAPHGMNYQAVARDAGGSILANQNICMDVYVTNGNGGPILYSEPNGNITTNQFGLFTMSIGSGNPSGFAAINWAGVTPWLHVVMDIGCAANPVDMGTSQVLSVPYALNALKADTALNSVSSADNHWATNGNHIYNSNSGYVGIGTTTPIANLNVVGASSDNTIDASNSSSGIAVHGIVTGTGAGGSFDGGSNGNAIVANNNSASTATAVITQIGGAPGLTVIGTVGIGTVNPVAQLHVTTTGATGNGYAIEADNTGSGGAGNFEITNAGNASPALYASTNGFGNAIWGNATGDGDVVYGYSSGTGTAGHFLINNAVNNADALRAVTNGTGNAINGFTNGTGGAGNFEITNAGNTSPALYASTNGFGNAIWGNASGDGDVIYGYSTGTGTAGYFLINNAANNADALRAVTNGSANAVTGSNTGTGRAGNFTINNAANSAPAFYGATNGIGRAGYFAITNAASTADAFYIYNSGGGYNINTSSTAYLSNGGVWTNASDITLKENITEVDGAALLAKVNQLPVTQWNYKREGATVKHIGPMAQDFYRLFSVGNNDKSISTIDPAGIALVAVKEQQKMIEELKLQNAEMKNQNVQLTKRIEALEKK